jgi:hypothetical protein
MKRTTLRSSKGKKLYAVRTKGGCFKDIQSYKRSSAQDQRTRSKEEIKRRRAHSPEDILTAKERRKLFDDGI